MSSKKVHFYSLNYWTAKRNRRIKLTFVYLFMSLLAILFIFPMAWMFAASTKTDSVIYTEMGKLASFFPDFRNIGKWFQSYISIIFGYNLWKYMLNSLLYGIIIVTGNIFVNSMAGYALAKYHFPGKKLIMVIIITLIIVPIETTIIPLYTIVHSLKLTGTILAIIIPPLVSVFNIFLFRQFFSSIPKELEEAALIDGANKFQIYRKIIIPLSKPIVATIATFTFIGVWNDYIWPIMVLPAPQGDSWPLYPVQAALNTIQQQPTITTSEIMSSLVTTTIPLIIVYVLAQKYIVEGLGHTGLK